MHKVAFPPVADARTRVLVLGSLPGDISLARSQYYGNPRNQFWRLMEAVTDTPLQPLGYPARLEALKAAGVGLWDVFASASRRGSLDAAIRDGQPNGLRDFAAGLPALRAVAFNGGKAAGTGRPLLRGGDALALVDLPSSSPAFTRPYAEKRELWLTLKPFLAG